MLEYQFIVTPEIHLPAHLNLMTSTINLKQGRLSDTQCLNISNHHKTMAYTNVCGKKLQAKLGWTLNESATSHSPALLPSSQSFAKRQLEKMGWTEGSGLGKRQEGITKHVTIKQREDTMGLGREKEKTREINNLWWKESVGGTLARLQQQQQQQRKKETKEKKVDKKAKKNKKDKNEKKISTADDDEDVDDHDDKQLEIKTYTDDELFIATGGARYGMRAQRRALGKWKRTESGTQLTALEALAKSNMEWNGRGSTTTTTTLMTEKERHGKTIIENNKKRKYHSSSSSNDNEMDDKCTITTTTTNSVISPSISEEEHGSVKAGANPDDDERRRLKKEKKKRKREASTTIISCTVNDNLTEDNGYDDDKHKKNKKDKKKKNK